MNLVFQNLKIFSGKEEWVTVIFGEDGKEIIASGVNPKVEKSVLQKNLKHLKFDSW